MKKMANFMITSAVPCVVQECGQLCSSMIEVDQEAAIDLLVLPLMDKILAEIPKSQGTSRLSRIHRYFVSSDLANKCYVPDCNGL